MENEKYHLLKVKSLSHKQYNFYVVPETKMLDNFWVKLPIFLFGWVWNFLQWENL